MESTLCSLFVCFLLFVCIYIAIGDPFNYRKGSINWFNSDTSLSQGRTWIFPHHIVILFFVFNDLRCDSVVHVIDICGIVYHHNLNYIFITWLYIDLLVYILPV